MRTYLHGGKAEQLGWTPEHYDQQQLAMGIEAELEHTDDREVAREIAMDHLAEQVLEGKPQDYYTRLAVMEANPKKTFRIARSELMEYLERSGWTVSKNLKVPHATSPDRTKRIWFKPAAVYLSESYPGGSHTLGNARSMWIDIRKVSPERVVEETGYIPMHTNARWSTSYVNDLPDSAFAYIEPGGRKDSQRKTVPRSLRHLPYKNHLGQVDLPHLRNALSRLSQVDGLSARKEKKIRERLEEMLNRHGGYQHAANHAADYARAMEIANEELAVGNDEVGVLRALRKAGFKDEVFNQAMALYAAEQRRRRLAMVEHGPTVQSALGEGLSRISQMDPFWRSRGYEREEREPRLRPAATAPRDLDLPPIELGSGPRELVEMTEDEIREELASQLAVGAITRQQYSEAIRRLRSEVASGKTTFMRNPEFTEEEAFAALHTRLATPMKFAAQQVEGGMHPDQATRAASAQYGLGQRDTDILHYVMDAYQFLETPVPPPMRHRFEPTVPPMRAQSHHFAVNRTALDIGSKALHVPSGNVIVIVGYQHGDAVVVPSGGGPTSVVPVSDLSHDAYEYQVVNAMTQLMERTDPAQVVKNLMKDDSDVSEEFAITAMEEAAGRIVEERR